MAKHAEEIALGGYILKYRGTYFDDDHYNNNNSDDYDIDPMDDIYDRYQVTPALYGYLEPGDFSILLDVYNGKFAVGIRILGAETWAEATSLYDAENELIRLLAEAIADIVLNEKAKKEQHHE